jgi:hypothetical protein
LAEALKSGGDLEKQERWDAAVKVYTATLAQFPETSDQLEPLVGAARTLDSEARSKSRLKRLEQDIAGHIEAGRLEEAEAALHEAETGFGHQADVGTWPEMLAAERTRIARAKAIRTVLDQARDLLKRRSFDPAKKAVRVALEKWGPDAELADFLNQVQTARRDHLAAIDSVRLRVQELFDKRDWAGAVAAVGLGTERFPDYLPFRNLLAEARKNREAERTRNDLERRITQIDALLDEQAFDDAAVLLRGALRDYPGDQNFHSRQQQLEVEIHSRAVASAFRESANQAAKLAQQKQWEEARKLLAPYLDEPNLQSAAQSLLDDFPPQETLYRARIQEWEKTARASIAAGRYQEAEAQLKEAAAQFPESEGFPPLLREARLGLSRQCQAEEQERRAEDEKRAAERVREAEEQQCREEVLRAQARERKAEEERRKQEEEAHQTAENVRKAEEQSVSLDSTTATSTIPLTRFATVDVDQSIPESPRFPANTWKIAAAAILTLGVGAAVWIGNRPSGGGTASLPTSKAIDQVTPASAAPELTVTPTALSVEYRLGQALPHRTLKVIMSPPAPVQVAVGEGNKWLAASLDAGTNTIAVSFRPAGLSGLSVDHRFRGTIEISPVAGTTSAVKVPVTLQMIAATR